MPEQQFIQKKIGRFIRERREEYGYTQEKLSELTDLDISFISEIECGKRNITLATLDKIRKALNVELERFFASSDPDKLPGRKEIIEYIQKALPKLDYAILKVFYTLISSLQQNTGTKDKRKK